MLKLKIEVFFVSNYLKVQVKTDREFLNSLFVNFQYLLISNHQKNNLFWLLIFFL